MTPYPFYHTFSSYTQQSPQPLNAKPRLPKARALNPEPLVLSSRWISDGEIEDPWGEFFIESDPSKPDHHWEDKYKMRPQMLPSFVSPSLANQVLAPLVSGILGFKI